MGLLRKSMRVGCFAHEWPKFVNITTKSDKISADVLDSFSIYAIVLEFCNSAEMGSVWNDVREVVNPSVDD